MAHVKGPFTIKWGNNTIEQIEDIDIQHEIDSEEYQTVQGQTIEIDGAYKVSATITLLASDIPALSAILPQYYVANGGILSTGETVTTATGAIDIKASSCATSTVYNNLDIMSCANPSQVLRIVNARSKIEGVELDDKLQKVQVKFIGEAQQGDATMQMFLNGTIAVVS